MTEKSDALLFKLLAALEPPKRTPPSEWAEASLTLPRESNAMPGKLRLTKAQKGMCDAAGEHTTRELILMTSAQIGKTVTIHAILGHAICGEGGPLMIVRPDENDVASYTRETLDPLIAASPVLRNKITGADNKSLKTFAGGSLALASSYKAPALSGKAIRVGICDEVDRFAAVTSNGEGAPIDLVKRRLHTFRRSLLVLASTPVFAQTSRIAANYERGDKRLFFVNCKHCGDEAPITQTRLHFEPGKPEGAMLKCEACGVLVDEAERLRMVESGEWRATAKGEPGVVSMHINELSSEFSSLAKVAAQVDGAKTLEQRKAVQNLTWGLAFEAANEIETDPGELLARAETIQAPYPAALDFITMGVDVQSNRLEASIVAHTQAGEKWVLDHVVLPGDTASSSVWNDLAAVMGRTFRIEDERELSINITFVDAGFQTEHVVRLCHAQRAKGRRIAPTFGRSGFDRTACKEGAKIRGLMRGLVIGVDNLKMNVAKALASGTIHLPNHLDADYFEQLSSERLTVRYVKGFPRYQWEKEPNVRNEAFDTLVLATAAATLVTGCAQSASKPKQSKPSLSIAEFSERMNNPKSRIA